MGYKMIETFTENQLTDLHNLFKNEWWTQERNLSDIQTAVEQSSVSIGLADEDTEELIAFGRILTDTVYRAFIFDVMTKESYRNRGVGTLLMERILEHRLIKNTERVELYCPENMIPYYGKFGFSLDVNGSRLMRYQRR